MLKANLKLFIIIFLAIVLVIFGVLYFSRSKNSTPTIEDTGGTNFFSKIFNSSKNDPLAPSGDQIIDISGGNQEGQAVKGKLMKVSSMPVAGYGIFLKERLKDVPPIIPVTPPATTDSATPTPTTKPPTVTPTAPLTEFVPAVRYVDRATGNIFQTFADKIEERKFTSTTIPQIYEAYLGNQAQSVVMRYLKPDNATISTFVGSLPKEFLGADTQEDTQVKGTFLPDNITDVSVSPDATKLFYLFKSGNSLLGTTLNFLDNTKSQIFSSSFTEWLPMWVNSGLITMTSKPSWNVLGYMFNINLSNGNSFNKSLGGINGLTTLTSPNGNLTLYTDNSLVLTIYHHDSRTSTELGLRTLPEKCVWGSASDTIYCAVPKTLGAGIYPDNWYQGEESFNDQLWKIDIGTGVTTLLLDPFSTPGAGEEVDGIKLALDEGENYLFFVNKKDSFLWKLDLK